MTCIELNRFSRSPAAYDHGSPLLRKVAAKAFQQVGEPRDITVRPLSEVFLEDPVGSSAQPARGGLATPGGPNLNRSTVCCVRHTHDQPVTLELRDDPTHGRIPRAGDTRDPRDPTRPTFDHTAEHVLRGSRQLELRTSGSALGRPPTPKDLREPFPGDFETLEILAHPEHRRRDICFLQLNSARSACAIGAPVGAGGGGQGGEGREVADLMGCRNVRTP